MRAEDWPLDDGQARQTCTHGQSDWRLLRFHARAGSDRGRRLASASLLDAKDDSRDHRFRRWRPSRPQCDRGARDRCMQTERVGRLDLCRALMPRWPRPQNLTRLFVGQHIINGASVGLGVVAVALVASTIFGFAAGQPATLGAISASISDLPAPWREKARTLIFGFALAMLSTVAIQLALPWLATTILMIGVISFVGGLVTGLGRW